MTKKTKKTRAEAKPLLNDQKLPFLEHFKELKRRLTIVAVSIGVFSSTAYFVQHQIVELLLKPAEGQKLIYTTPAGGMNFLIQVCLYTGVVFSLPVIIYNVIKYVEPLMGRKSVRFALFGSIVSAVLAIAGMLFGYYAGLPAALHFLFNQFSPSSEIQPLIAVQSYLSFVTLYMFGAALLFQVALVLIFINRIRPLKPRSLLKGERWFIALSFVLAFVMNPTPNIIEQVMLAGPMIVMYQIGIGLIWLVNRRRTTESTAVLAATEGVPAILEEFAAKQVTRLPSSSAEASRHRKALRGRKSAKIASLRAQDATIQAERLARLADAQQIWHEAATIAERPVASVVAIADHKPPAIVSATLAPQSITVADEEDPIVQDAPTPSPISSPVPVTIPVENTSPARIRAIANRPRRYVDGIAPTRLHTTHHITPHHS